jgi:hypothetical protein
VNYQGYLEKYWGYPGPVLKPTSKPMPDQSTPHMKANPSFAVRLSMESPYAEMPAFYVVTDRDLVLLDLDVL